MLRLKSLTQIALCGALIALLSQLVLPLPAGVPMTLQTLGVAFCGFYLEKKKGSAAVLLYLLLGAVGLPVFSAFSGGFGRLLGPSGGFLWGFLPYAFFCGMKGNGWKRLAYGSGGLLLCHGAGALWYAASCKMEIGAAILATSVPTLWKDVICLGAAYLIAKRLKRILQNQRFS